MDKDISTNFLVRVFYNYHQYFESSIILVNHYIQKYITRPFPGYLPKFPRIHAFLDFSFI